MALTNIKVKEAKPAKKKYKLFDGGGLYLLVHPTGGKYWQIKYRYNGEKTFSVGSYPSVSLAAARKALRDVKETLERDEDPNLAKRQEKIEKRLAAGQTFEVIARNWIEWRSAGLSDRYVNTVIYRLERYVFPRIGFRPIADISPTELIEIFIGLDKDGKLDLLRKLLQTCSGIYRFAIASGKAERNIANDLKGLFRTGKVKNNARLRESDLPEFLHALGRYDGREQTRIAMDIVMNTFVRTIEIRGVKWSELDLKNQEWIIPADRMKMDRDHIVPLSRQVVEGFKKMKGLNQAGEFVFPHERNPERMMSENTLLYALYRLGYRGKATVHGFRGTASTILNENGFNRDWIEIQLAHWDSGSVRAAYNHAQYLCQRREMMQWYSDRIDTIRAQGEVDS